MKAQTIFIIWALAATAALAFSVRECARCETRAQACAAAGDTAGVHTATILRGQVAEAKVQLIYKGEESRRLAANNLALADIVAQAKGTAVIKYRTVQVPFTGSPQIDTVYIDSTRPAAQCLVLPAPVSYSSTWLQIKGSITDSGLTVDTMAIPVAPAFAIGYERLPLLRSLRGEQPGIRVTYSDANPHVQPLTVSAITVKPAPLKWYQTRGFAFAAGIAAGLFIPVQTK